MTNLSVEGAEENAATTRTGYSIGDDPVSAAAWARFYQQGVRIKELTQALEAGRQLVEEMDLRMPEHATEDEDGWINSYRIPTGPWHRLLGWSRGTALNLTRQALSTSPLKGRDDE